MTRLQEMALATLPMSQETVEAFYNGLKPWSDWKTFQTLCESHERLRAEVQGCESMLEDGKRDRLNVLEDVIDHAFSLLRSIPCECQEGDQCSRCTMLLKHRA